MYSVGCPMVTAAEVGHTSYYTYEEASRETIEQREQLQKSVIKHTSRILDEVNKRLREMEGIIDQKLSPIHLRCIMHHIREDLHPLKGYINRISNHGKHIGALQKDLEMSKCKRKGGLSICELSSTSSSSHHSIASYLVNRNARQLSPPKVLSKSLPSDPQKKIRKRSGQRKYGQPQTHIHNHFCSSLDKSTYLTPSTSPNKQQSRLWTPTVFKEQGTSISRQITPTNRCRRISPLRGFEEKKLKDCNAGCNKLLCPMHKDILQEGQGDVPLTKLLAKEVSDGCDGTTDPSQCPSMTSDKQSSDLVTSTDQTISTDTGSSDVNGGDKMWKREPNINLNLRATLALICRKLKCCIVGKLRMGTLEVITVLLLVYLSLYWWKGIAHRLGVVYRAYAGEEKRRIIPVM